MAFDIRIDEAKNIARIRGTGKVTPQDVLDAFDRAVSQEKYKAGMGRLWDFSKIDLSSLDPSFIPQMTKHSLSFPEGIRDVKVAFVVKKTMEYGLVRMFQIYSEFYADTEVTIFDTTEEAERWMMEE